MPHGKPLPLITTTDAGADEDGDKNVMVYSFRLCLTKEPANRVPFPEPANYDPARFEVVRRYFAAGEAPASCSGISIRCRAASSTRTTASGNNSPWASSARATAGAKPMQRAARKSGRRTSNTRWSCITSSPPIPRCRNTCAQQLAELGLCRDEFADSRPLVAAALRARRPPDEGRVCRSARRTSSTSRQKDDPIVVSSFPIDSHDCQRVALKDGGVINEGTIFPVRMPGRRHGYRLSRAVSQHPAEAGGMRRTCSCPSRSPARMWPIPRSAWSRPG